MLVLSIMHNIFLSKEEIEKLIKDKEIETIGASLPVWYLKGNTSEPAEEVFCKYKLKISNKKEGVSVLKNGYVINFQELPDDYKEPDLSPEEIEAMTQEQFEEWQNKNPKMANIKDLLNEKEKATFRQFTKKKQSGYDTTLVHVVEVSKMEKLLKTIV